MKIGVITFSQTKDNYGQILQCYAMQKFLQQLGHNPYLIQYNQKSADKASFKFSKLFKYIFNFGKYVRWYLNNRNIENQKRDYQLAASKIDRKFHQFLEDNLTLSPIFQKEQLLSDPPKADAYICGSDQIWKRDDIFYLSFAPKTSIRIAYAPSFGGEMSFPEEVERMIKKELSHFSFLGIREQGGVELCHRLGFMSAVKVVDPTLLLTKSDYDQIKTNVNKANFIFVYLLGNPTDCSIDDIYSYARDIGKDVIYVCSQGRSDNYEKTYATIGEWLGYLSNADIVITNSFHCTVFSLIYNKKFVSLPLTRGYEKMNGRLEDLLGQIGLSDRIWNDNLEEICNSEIDFAQFNNYVSLERQKSKNYLTTVLLK